MTDRTPTLPGIQSLGRATREGSPRRGMSFAPDKGTRPDILATRESAEVRVTALGDIMADPRNVAHDKKVQEEKKHHGEEVAPGAIETPQPGKKPTLEKDTGEAESYQQHAHHHKADDTPE